MQPTCQYSLFLGSECPPLIVSSSGLENRNNLASCPSATSLSYLAILKNVIHKLFLGQEGPWGFSLSLGDIYSFWVCVSKDLLKVVVCINLFLKSGQQGIYYISNTYEESQTICRALHSPKDLLTKFNKNILDIYCIKIKIKMLHQKLFHPIVEIRGRSRTTLTRFCLFWPPTPLRWLIHGGPPWLILQKVDIFRLPIHLLLST